METLWKMCERRRKWDKWTNWGKKKYYEVCTWEGEAATCDTTRTYETLVLYKNELRL